MDFHLIFPLYIIVVIYITSIYINCLPKNYITFLFNSHTYCTDLKKRKSMYYIYPGIYHACYTYFNTQVLSLLLASFPFSLKKIL